MRILQLADMNGHLALCRIRPVTLPSLVGFACVYSEHHVPTQQTPSMVAGTHQWRPPFHARGLQEDMVKSGEIWVLKSRVTAQDSDIHLPLPIKGRAMQAGKLLCCSMLQKLFASTEWCQNLTR
jgi:hypothetical protein